jgi:hypothetical protein
VAGTVITRTIKQGSVTLVWARITELTGADISAVGMELSHVLDEGSTTQPGVWEAPHVLSNAPLPSVRRLAKLVTGTLVDGAKTKYRVFVRATDNPEIDIIDCGTYTVTV